MVSRSLLLTIYRKMLQAFGHRSWWPGDTAFEIIVGAILTQNTAWKNVEKAIINLKAAGVLSPRKMRDLPDKNLAKLIRPSGYFNLKALRIKSFLNFLFENYGGDLRRLFRRHGTVVRRELLAIKGIGPETADSILLYAGKKPFFVVDAYTKRIFSRHGFFSEQASYEEVQRFFADRLPSDPALFNDYHAQLVVIGQRYCKRGVPLCTNCPLNFLFENK